MTQMNKKVSLYITLRKHKKVAEMKHRLAIIFSSTMLVLIACGQNTPPSPTTSPTKTPVSVTETSTPLSVEAKNVFTFDEMGIIIGFNYPENFNQGTNTTVIETYQSQAPFELAYPQHARILFTSYAGEREDILAAGIRVFRVDDINALEAGVIENLFAVLLGQADHYSDFPKLTGAASVIDGQLATGEFQNGNGYRFLNSKSFDASSLISSQTNYLYQGITNDEKYFVSVVFVVDAPFLADLVNVPLTTNEEFENYFQIVQDRIKNANPNDFQPSLMMLDALVSSIVIVEK